MSGHKTANGATPFKLELVKRGIKYRDLKAQTGLSESHISRIANGLRPNAVTRAKLTTALGMKEKDLWPN